DCGGSGRRKTPATLRLEILRELRKCLELAPENALRLRVHPDIASSIREDWDELLAALGAAREGALVLEETQGLPIETYEILSR
ncbi:MAG TPA: hypothetical protein VKJ00_05425, partial [Thermoanaerobaculia bacterium]|nr:hypothetical protein [Thermoanaerobaculia bacterium]